MRYIVAHDECTVVLTGISSNRRDRIVALATGPRSCGGERAEALRRAAPVRLSREQIAGLINQYQSGHGVTALAVQFGIHRTTVRRIVKRHDQGVASVLTTRQAASAAEIHRRR
ncbi:MAG: hypothetical protein DLM57_08140 [Pseudonocardiales bacterium]|nr:MAG: hypothetical protein DLM57_08140 [Pseudonocardiales bacterium]